MRFNFFKRFIGMFISHDKPLNFVPYNKSINNEDSMKKIKCALVIGHKQSSQGAYNETYKIHEFEFNEELANVIIGIEFDHVEIHKIYRRTYSSLPNDINELNPDFVISLHCNAFNKKASGSEVLYYHKSEKSKQYANILQKNFVRNLELSDRGIHGKTSEDRGGYLLKNTIAPCIIAEPFFIDNDEDYKIAGIDKYSELLLSYKQSIAEIASSIEKGK